MKVLILSHYWHPENGVPQRRWSWLTKILVRAGHEVVVVCPPPHHERETSFFDWIRSFFSGEQVREFGLSGEKIVRSGYFPNGNSITRKAFNQGVVSLSILWNIFLKRGELKGFKPDIVIGTVPAVPTSVIVPIVSYLYRVPYVIDLRDSWPELLSEGRDWNSAVGETTFRQKLLSKGPFQILSFVTKHLMYWSFRSAVGMIFTSSYHENDLLMRREMRGTHLRTTTIRNVFPPKSASEVKFRNVANGEPLNVLYAGTLGRAQNLTNAVEAAKIAQEKGLIVNLRFVGAGASSRELRRQIKKLGVSGEVFGRVSAAELSDHYEWADSALVHLTNWNALEHAVPSKTYELMDIGLHISGVVRGETSELIEKLESGDVVEPENPEALANLWMELSKDRGRLKVSPRGKHWVIAQRDDIVPARLLEFMSDLGIS
ncbi:glycosyltransferase family 4 protein [Corynebacterium glutamicum]|uniref:glycosyltransferase family 4 protein n=1 Tax=Corynebacterium glutamicum TaxID=1718 RepID=UPI000945A82B|nr:glycosyltransferase family 4 protein [Corynebacterium glutamicum]OKX86065.1 hypothetical protein AUO96_09525 [Corynebacterium glutamicum]QDX74610.1 hypothetical protein AKL15_01985 [Corynebacterium glutamicum]QDX77372.1 hypothetical protein AKL16_01990 [Corynebacterium glutamicum]TWS34502.1 hypothetical protein AKJ19_08365 [Corynebacterium glutamicum]TWS38056.1 hypothetical protein AKJ20_00360 [Corynebacterium glutamicum]